MTTSDQYIVYDGEKRGGPTIGTAPTRSFNGPADAAEELCGGEAEEISLGTLRKEFENGGLNDQNVEYVVVGELSPDDPVPGSLQERFHRDPKRRVVTAIRITHGPDHGLVRDPVQEIADAAHRAAAAASL